MQLYTIDTGFFKLDGGAMFGVVPKTIWQKLNPPDNDNLCTWAMRCLLIEDGNQLVLIDTGMGDKQSEKFFSYYQPHGDATLLGSLKKHGFSPADITDVILTHLHFDHCGGAIYRDGEKLVPTFPNATYWSHESHWQWATHPNDREKASFLSENILPLEESGQLRFMGPEEHLFEGFSYLLANGHTESQIIPHIRYKDKTIVYMADLLPSPGHLPIPYVMGYDTRPLITLQEKKSFLEKAMQEDYILFFEHDPHIECCTLQMTDKGVRMAEALSLKEAIG
ncbi:MAG: MBL fold metallo-hydrolase [Chitinophagales bacterium]|nr:MBL fold metallo-hydrolase [Chitinophagales bacterium]